VEEYSKAGKATDDNTRIAHVHCMVDT